MTTCQRNVIEIDFGWDALWLVVFYAVALNVLLANSKMRWEKKNRSKKSHYFEHIISTNNLYICRALRSPLSIACSLTRTKKAGDVAVGSKKPMLRLCPHRLSAAGWQYSSKGKREIEHNRNDRLQNGTRKQQHTAHSKYLSCEDENNRAAFMPFWGPVSRFNSIVIVSISFSLCFFVSFFLLFALGVVLLPEEKCDSFSLILRCELLISIIIAEIKESILIDMSVKNGIRVSTENKTRRQRLWILCACFRKKTNIEIKTFAWNSSFSCHSTRFPFESLPFSVRN